MFTACTHSTVKKVILENFPKRDSVLRVVVVTIAFRMGLDSLNIRRIIHWGPSSDIESYSQETGRAGQDGLQAAAELYQYRLGTGKGHGYDRILQKHNIL